jgi:hypothetical protein
MTLLHFGASFFKWLAILNVPCLSWLCFSCDMIGIIWVDSFSNDWWITNWHCWFSYSSRLGAHNPRWVSWSTKWHARCSGVSSIHVTTWLLQEFFPPLLDEPNVPWSELSVWYFMTRLVNKRATTTQLMILSTFVWEAGDSGCNSWRRTCHRKRFEPSAVTLFKLHLIYYCFLLLATSFSHVHCRSTIVSSPTKSEFFFLWELNSMLLHYWYKTCTAGKLHCDGVSSYTRKSFAHSSTIKAKATLQIIHDRG